MPIRRIVLQPNGFGSADSSQIDMASESIGNRKYKCTSAGICINANTPGYYQYPCENEADCVPVPAEELLDTCINFGDNITSEKYFGNTKETGCKDKPWDFVVDYNCPSANTKIVYYDANNDGIADAQNDGIAWSGEVAPLLGYMPRFVCVAYPRVQILDNWGWCTGDCPSGGTVSGSGCYSDKAGGNECDTRNSVKPWVNFGDGPDVKGRVIIIPVQ
jgi:hypothetical protein